MNYVANPWIKGIYKSHVLKTCHIISLNKLFLAKRFVPMRQINLLLIYIWCRKFVPRINLATIPHMTPPSQTAATLIPQTILYLGRKA